MSTDPETTGKAVSYPDDVSKMADIIVSLNALKNRHTFADERYKALQVNINGLIDKIIAYATK